MGPLDSSSMDIKTWVSVVVNSQSQDAFDPKAPFLICEPKRLLAWQLSAAGQPVRWLTCQVHHEKELDFSGTRKLPPRPAEGKGLFVSLFCCPKAAQSFCRGRHFVHLRLTLGYGRGESHEFSRPGLTELGLPTARPKAEGTSHGSRAAPEGEHSELRS